jgi:hypothetical protein
VVYSTSWLVDRFGLPSLEGPIKFHVEYITTNKKYIGTNKMAFTISEVIDDIIEDAKHNTVGRMLLCPVVLNEVCNFQLMSCERF